MDGVDGVDGVDGGLLQGTLRLEDVTDEESIVATALIAYGVPDAAGHYRLEGVPAGEYTLALKATDADHVPHYAFSPVSVRDGEMQTADIDAR